MMGFPDGWTGVAKVSRTARLRMLGNAVVVDVAELLGHAID